MPLGGLRIFELYTTRRSLCKLRRNGNFVLCTLRYEMSISSLSLRWRLFETEIRAGRLKNSTKKNLTKINSLFVQKWNQQCLPCQRSKTKSIFTILSIQSAANSLRLFLQSKYGLRNFRNDYFICSKVAVLFPKSFSNTSTMKIWDE